MKINVKGFVNGLVKTVFAVSKEKAPELLTATGLILGAGTVYIVAKKAPEAKERKDEALENAKEAEKGTVGTAVEVAKATLPVYAPAILTGAASAACFIASNRISASRLATMTAAYSLVSEKFENYKKTAQEVLGEAKSSDLDRKAIERKMAESKSDEEKPVETTTQYIGDKYLYYDVFSDRYFRAMPDDLRNAENKLNLRLFNDDEVELNDWYSEIGLNRVKVAEGWGWTAQSVALKGGIDFKTIAVLTPSGGTCSGIDFDTLEPLWSARKRRG